MSDFTVLLNNLIQTCQELEQIKAQHTKDHERISKSFEKTLLSILKQEETILNHVEEEHRRLKDKLSSIQQDNDLALQNGTCQINNFVQEICTVSSQIKQALVTSNDSESVMREIKDRVSNIFVRNNNFIISLKKVHFIPQPLLSTTLGEISCEEQSLGISSPCMKNRPPLWTRNTIKPTLLSEEKPPWEDKSLNSDDVGFVGVKIVPEKDSDQGSGTSTKIEDIAAQTLSISSKDQAVMKADNAALSPRTATKNWISDIKHSPNRQQGVRTMVQAKEGNKSQNQHHVGSRQTSKASSRVSKSSYLQLNRVKTGRNQQLRRTFLRDTEDKFPDPISLTKHHSYTNNINIQKENMELLESRGEIAPTVNSPTSDNCKTVVEDLTHSINDHNTLFTATAAYICEEDSDTSEDIVEEIETDGVKDPKACRQVAIRDSRVPSAKKYNVGEQQTSWMSLESSDQINSTSQNVLTSCLNKQYLESQPTYKSNLGDDYMRMSYDGIDRNKDTLEIPPRPTSPSESVSSSYTFIIESPKNKASVVRSGTFTRSPHLPPKECRKSQPVVTGEVEKSKTKSRQETNTFNGKHRLISKIRNQRSQPPLRPVPRSSSMPYIERISRPRTAPSRPLRPTSAKERRDSLSSTTSSRSNSRSVPTSTPSSSLGDIRIRIKPSQYGRRTTKVAQQLSTPKYLGKSEPNITSFLLENDGVTEPVRQFGKFGSGRAELNLPHGIHATSTGSIYVVDYGNRRLQVMDSGGKILQQFALEAKNYFDVAVSNRGLVALTNSSDRTVDVYSKHGRLLQVISRNWGTPRGITANHRDEFIIADMKLGAICALTLDTTTGRQKESITVTGFNKPYLVSSNSQGLLAVSERGLDGGCCVKVLREDLQLLKVLGLKDTPGPTLFNPWGVCVDNEGGVLVADWGQKHSIIYYPAKKPARFIVTEGLSSPRGLAMWQDCLVLVADSMHNCIKVFQYQESE